MHSRLGLFGNRQEVKMDYNEAIRAGTVNFGMDFDAVETVSRLFGRSAKRIPYRDSFNVPNQPNTIAWLVAEDGGHGWTNMRELGSQSDSRGFREVLAIREFNADDELTQKRIDEELANPKTRYVFYRESNDGVLWYKFYGAFSVNRSETEESLMTERPCVVYSRVSTSAKCRKAEVSIRDYSAEEFAAAKGKIVEINLLDEIPFVADCGKEFAGEVRAWPGTKLVVDDVLKGMVKVACSTLDEQLLEDAWMKIPVNGRAAFQSFKAFYIPKRDFELGYVRVLGEGGVADTRSDGM